MDVSLFEESRLFRKFDQNSMNILKWLNIFEYLVSCLEIDKDLITDYLLNMLENSTFQTLVEKLAPRKPSECSYKEITSLLMTLYTNFDEESAAKYRFKYRKQMIKESVNQFAQAILSIIGQCSPDFNTEKNLLERFIKGLRSKEIKKHLSKVQNLSFTEALTIAEEIEFNTLLIKVNNFEE